MPSDERGARPSWHADPARRASLGWSDFFDKQLARLERSKRESMLPVRVAAEHRGRYEIWGHPKADRARLAGRLRKDSTREQLPAVGDWALAPRRVHGLATLAHVFERHSAFLRKAAGQVTEAQVVAANVDTVLLVCSLNRDYSARRIERYLTQLYESGARPVVVLSKADVAASSAIDVDATCAELAAQLDIEVVTTRTDDPASIEALRRFAGDGQTVALVGSSGVGKSTIINALVGEQLLATSEVREDDDRGRHTTRHRQLVALPERAGLLVDTPGMRELSLWDGAGLGEAFDDVLAVAARCHFRDCSHEGEPGCAVPDALASGELDAERYEHFCKLTEEAATQAARREQRGWSEGQRPGEAGARGGGAGWRELEKKD
ncbi:MAG: ribosome small subunit-dependent GTPase A [Myxococcales bacterium]|nr:ribosome small subunit-dependent GTPase A [Myxococcales bacterium]